MEAFMPSLHSPLFEVYPRGINALIHLYTCSLYLSGDLSCHGFRQGSSAGKQRDLCSWELFTDSESMSFHTTVHHNCSYFLQAPPILCWDSLFLMLQFMAFSVGGSTYRANLQCSFHRLGTRNYP